MARRRVRFHEIKKKYTSETESIKSLVWRGWSVACRTRTQRLRESESEHDWSWTRPSPELLIIVDDSLLCLTQINSAFIKLSLHIAFTSVYTPFTPEITAHFELRWLSLLSSSNCCLCLLRRNEISVSVNFFHLENLKSDSKSFAPLSAIPHLDSVYDST